MCDCLSIGRYLPDATGAIYDVLKEMSKLHASKKKRYDNEDAELLENVAARLITKETLTEKLAQHVEQVSSTLSNNMLCGLGLCGRNVSIL